MRRENNEGDSGIPTRTRAGVIVGYIGFVFGLLAVLTAASEAEAFPPNQAAATVLASMVAAYCIGWLLQPLIDKTFRAP